MRTIFAVKRLTFLAVAAMGLAGCGPYSCLLTLACGTNVPHTDYYMVTFLPDTPAPSEAGIDAIANAVHQAGRRTPQSIAVTGSAPPGAPVPPLEQQRADVIADAFIKAGIDARLIRKEITPRPEASYAEHKDSFTVGLDYGNLPKQ
jgi:hypothetical protein